MTYTEARQLVRKVYDQWDAIRKLHEVLEKAAEAESFLSQSTSDVVKKKSELAIMESQYSAKLESHRMLTDKMDTEINQQKAYAADALVQLSKTFDVAKKEYQEKLDGLSQEFVTAQREHQVMLEGFKKEADQARHVTEALVAEMEKAKKRVSALFG